LLGGKGRLHCFREQGKPDGAQRWDLTKKRDEWVAEAKGRRRQGPSRTKREAVRAAAKPAIKAGTPISLRIHGVNGRVQEERTYLAVLTRFAARDSCKA
jgi:hypothetical protein